MTRADLAEIMPGVGADPVWVFRGEAPSAHGVRFGGEMARHGAWDSGDAPTPKGT